MSKRYDDVMSLSLRRGFIWQAVDIYGGLAGFYDYGHLGARVKRNWEDLWLKYFLSLNDNFHLIDTINILPYAALKSSGHVSHFTDYLVRCGKCSSSYKADQLIEEETNISAEALSAEEIDSKVEELGIKCPKCKGTLGKASPFNTMFPLLIGPAGKEKAFLRPETAQGAYLNFKREFESLRKKLPLGLAIIGKIYRNEISPRQGVYRLREIIQAELQIFFDPDAIDKEIDFDEIADYVLKIYFVKDREKNKVSTISCKELADEKILPRFYIYYMAKVQQFYLNELNIPIEKFRFFELSEKERAHYAKLHFDIEIDLETLGGFKEMAGIHYRGDYDLKSPEQGSNQKMTVFLDGRRFIPHVIELSFGVDRNVWALLDTFFVKEERTIFKLPKQIAPYSAAVFPLVNKDNLPKKANELYNELKKELTVFYDTSGSIGRRYARMDEVGTPYCITIDYQTLEDNTVTIRDRDTAKQIRVSAGKIMPFLSDLIKGKEVIK